MHIMVAAKEQEDLEKFLKYWRTKETLHTWEKILGGNNNPRRNKR